MTATPSCQYTPLVHLTAVEVSGEDRLTFLQGQLTNDTRLLTPTLSQLTGYCTPKGRLLALLRLVEIDEQRLLIILPQAIAETTLKRLRMFIMRSKVTIAAVADTPYQLYGLWGEQAKTALTALMPTLPETDNASMSHDGITAIHLPAAQPRYLLAVDTRTTNLNTLQQQCTAAAVNAWTHLDIDAALPEINSQTSEAFVPQMVNLQLLDGVNFKKGCYTGQEVVARMQYLGKLKRRMYRAHCTNTTTEPQTGDELASPLSESGQGAGKIVSVAKSEMDGYALLVVLESVIAEAPAATAAITLVNDSHATIEILENPYPFND
ncbi:MAG: folate-binding protein YgfZ [Gammaproteobacteria bacterium]|nr:folate-binding protein YgfZ [Gammaproteobacteria bacterium]